MEPKSPETNDLVFDIHVRLQLKDFRAKLGLKKAWAVALVVALVQVGLKLWLNHSR